MSQLRAVALMGATGTGKSALAMRLAQENGATIICCDSMQLYRRLDIGTAKPTLEERGRVKHALVDCCDLPDLYSAARWAEEAREVIRQENAQGRSPLIVGGTGFYLKALLEGFADIPVEDAAVRAELEALHKEGGTALLYLRLQQRDPVMAGRLAPGDSQRIMRALSVLASSGRSLADWQEDARQSHEPIECPVFVLSIERSLLRERIKMRFLEMMAAGWLDETRWLASLALPDTHPAMRAVGYRQLLDYLDGRLSLDQAVVDGVTATRRYAKRQVTWFSHQVIAAANGDAGYLQDKVKRALVES